jgi:hypothetical protein
MSTFTYEQVLKYFADIDDWNIGNVQSLFISNQIIEQRQLSNILNSLGWNSFREHPFDLSVIKDIGQLFRTDPNVISDDYWRREQRLKLIKLAWQSTNAQKLIFNAMDNQYMWNQVKIAERNGDALRKTFITKKSTINGAGNGLFTTENLKKGEPLGLYGSYAFLPEEGDQFLKFKNLAEDFVDYPFSTSGWCPYRKMNYKKDDYIRIYPSFIDSSVITDENVRDLNLMAFANQTFDFDKLNAVFLPYDWTPFIFPEVNFALIKPVVLIATRDIVEGEEIFTDYGYSYWNEKPGGSLNIEGMWQSPEERKVFQDKLEEIPNTFPEWLQSIFPTQSIV